MSLMSGFDLLIEISNETIRKLLQTNLQIGGVSANPPFELSFPISDGAAGTAHVIVTDLQVDLNDDDTISLTLMFDRTSVGITAPFPLAVCPLDGNIVISDVKLETIDDGNSNQQVSVDLGTATVAINWSAAAKQEITKTVAGTAVTFATFTTYAMQALASFVQGIGAQNVPLTFNVVSGQDGSFTPFLQLERIEVHCIPNVERSKQALGIFGILLASNDSNGDHNQKTSTAITAPNDGVCFSIAPVAFHSRLFCPAIANAITGNAANVGQLPKTCGPSSGFDTQGVTIKSIADSFADGHINIDGSVSKSGFCYDASGTFHGKIELSMGPSGLIPSVDMDKPDIDVSIDCWGFGVFVAVTGPIGIGLEYLIEKIAEKIATDLANDALKNSLRGGIPVVPLSGFPGTSFSSVSLTTEGLTLQGSLPIFIPSAAIPTLNLNGSVITTKSEEKESGVYSTTVCPEIGAKDYHYSAYAQQQSASYQLTGALITQPFTAHYAVSADNGIHWQSLTGVSGTLTLKGVTTYHPTPQGFTSMQQEHSIAYSISDTGIELTNNPNNGEDGNYGFDLRVTATDCNGDPVQDGTGKLVSAGAAVNFEGYRVDLSQDGYFHDFVFCKNQMTKSPSGPPPKPGPYPVSMPVDEELLLTYVRDVLALGIPQTDEILRISQIAYGNAFLRAIASPAAQKPGSLKTRALLTANQQQLAKIALELINFSQRLGS
jgi:hypothetical protein